MTTSSLKLNPCSSCQMKDEGCFSYLAIKHMGLVLGQNSERQLLSEDMDIQIDINLSNCPNYLSNRGEVAATNET